MSASERFYCVAWADSEQELQEGLHPSARVLVVYHAGLEGGKSLHFIIECSSVRGQEGAVDQAKRLAGLGLGLEHAHSLPEARQTVEQWFHSEVVERRQSRFDEAAPLLGARSRRSGLGA